MHSLLAFAAALNFMSNSSIEAGGSDSANLPDVGSALGRAPDQQGDLPDTACTNGHLPSGNSEGQPEGTAVPLHAPLQGSQASYGTRQRGDGGRDPERQGSYNRSAYAPLT